jgi:hypothetical protein
MDSKKRRGPAPKPPQDKASRHLGTVVTEAVRDSAIAAAREAGVSLSFWIAEQIRNGLDKRDVTDQ